MFVHLTPHFVSQFGSNQIQIGRCCRRWFHLFCPSDNKDKGMWFHMLVGWLWTLSLVVAISSTLNWTWNHGDDELWTLCPLCCLSIRLPNSLWFFLSFLDSFCLYLHCSHTIPCLGRFPWVCKLYARLKRGEPNSANLEQPLPSKTGALCRNISTHNSRTRGWKHNESSCLDKVIEIDSASHHGCTGPMNHCMEHLVLGTATFNCCRCRPSVESSWWLSW